MTYLFSANKQGLDDIGVSVRTLERSRCPPNRAKICEKIPGAKVCFLLASS